MFISHLLLDGLFAHHLYKKLFKESPTFCIFCSFSLLYVSHRRTSFCLCVHPIVLRNIRHVKTIGAEAPIAFGHLVINIKTSAARRPKSPPIYVPAIIIRHHVNHFLTAPLFKSDHHLYASFLFSKEARTADPAVSGSSRLFHPGNLPI